jgi:hypothetical protein
MSGFLNVRLMWSAISITEPRAKVRLIPPAAFVSSSVRTPSSAKTLTGRAVVLAG